jgi:hypothetical protein
MKAVALKNGSFQGAQKNFQNTDEHALDKIGGLPPNAYWVGYW